MRRQSILVLLHWTIFLIFVIGLIPIHSQNTDIVHLKKEDFDAFFKETDTWDKWYENRNCENWRSPFVCWDQRTRTLLVPGLIKMTPSKRRLPDSLAVELIDWSRKKNPLRPTYLITNNDMIYISLKYLMENKYQLVSWLKNICHHPEDEIKFYIFDFSQKDRLNINYCIGDISGNLLLITDTNSVRDSDYIEEWKSLLNVSFPDVRIKVKISGLIGDRALIDISSPVPKIAFSDTSKSSSPVNYKDISTVITGSIPIIELEFNLSSVKDLEMIKTEGIWLGKIEKNARITYSSLHYLIFEYYQKTRARFENNTFELFYARTNDFYVGESDFTREIENDDLPTILSFIKEIVGKKDKKIIVQLIGYADIAGKEGDVNEWKKKNFELAILRAEKVKEWFEGNLTDLSDRVEFEAKGCSKEYYNYSDRCVDIKVF